MSLLQRGDFVLSSGQRSWYKIDCDALSEEEIDIFAEIICSWIAEPIRGVFGIPSGGTRLAFLIGERLSKQNVIQPTGGFLIVDDVLTTGASMERAWNQFQQGTDSVRGAVIFARTVPPPWIRPVFQLSTGRQLYG